MDTMKDILEWAGYILAAIGFGVTIYKTVEVWLNLKRFSWSEVDKYSKVLIKKMSKDFFVPDVIVGIGRGGAIVGSILSGNIVVPTCKKERNIPILGVDRLYEWQHGTRVEIDNKMVDFSPLAEKKVLLVAGDVLTGGTMKFYVQQLEQAKVAELRTGCLVKGVAATFRPDYFGKEIPADFNMPWMYKGYGYSRDSRKPLNDKKQA